VAQANRLQTAGAQQGVIIAAYLVSRMKAGQITAAQAVRVVATYIAQQADQMLAAGTVRDDILVWLSGLKFSVAEYIARFLRQHESHERVELRAAI
jgi:energy-coupling factor transporter ATP-binding protein EcfA2